MFTYLSLSLDRLEVEVKMSKYYRLIQIKVKILERSETSAITKHQFYCFQVLYRRRTYPMVSGTDAEPLFSGRRAGEADTQP